WTSGCPSVQSTITFFSGRWSSRTWQAERRGGPHLPGAAPSLHLCPGCRPRLAQDGVEDPAHRIGRRIHLVDIVAVVDVAALRAEAVMPAQVIRDLVIGGPAGKAPVEPVAHPVELFRLARRHAA